MSAIMQGRFTRPGWSRAHALVVAATVGEARLLRTVCGRDFNRVGDVFADPAQAPGDMPHCRGCLRRAESGVSS